MRTILFFAVTCFVSTFGLLAGLGNHHEMINLLTALATWLPFLLYYRARERRINAQRRRAYLQEAFHRSYLRKNGHPY